MDNQIRVAEPESPALRRDVAALLSFGIFDLEDARTGTNSTPRKRLKRLRVRLRREHRVVDTHILSTNLGTVEVEQLVLFGTQQFRRPCTVATSIHRETKHRLHSGPPRLEHTCVLTIFKNLVSDLDRSEMYPFLTLHHERRQRQAVPAAELQRPQRRLER